MAEGDTAQTEAARGRFTRDTRYITTRVTADGRDGYPVEPGATGWWSAGPARGPAGPMVVRRLLGLEHALPMGICGPIHDERSWTFDLDPGGRDPVLGIERLQEAYFARFPGYDKGHHRAGHRRRADRAGGHQRLPRDHPGPVLRVAALPPRGAPDL